jgi:glyoxylase-like metal-dependent hydrolase (beta-lactamase superfamily II)
LIGAPHLPKGVHVFERGWLSANNILFTAGANTLMVDSGYCTHSEQTVALVEGVLDGRSLDFLVNTHLHSDHCGGNAALQLRYTALQTLIPPGQAAHITDWDPVLLTYQPTGQLCPQFSFSHILRPGTEIRFGETDWQIYSAPGHDPNSLIFFEPIQKLLISADALWENGFGVVFPELEGEKAFDEVDATLDLIEQLNPATVIPGHGAMFSYSTVTLEIARRRLDAFSVNPLKHAQHASKVLIKFKLLEIQRQSLDEFSRWALNTPYLQQIRNRFFPDVPMNTWIEELCDELCKAGVAARDDTHIFNG